MITFLIPGIATLYNFPKFDGSMTSSMIQKQKREILNFQPIFFIYFLKNLLYNIVW